VSLINYTGIQHLKKTRPATGWSRGSGSSDEALKDELLKVRRDFDSLSTELAEAKLRGAPVGVDELSQGSESTEVVLDFSEGGSVKYGCKWEDLFRGILPYTLGAGAMEKSIASTIAHVARELGHQWTRRVLQDSDEVVVSRNSFGKVMNQMVALGFVEAKPYPESPAVTLWHATPYGLREGARLIAIKRGAFS
jgi:hypothetical protein